MIVSILTAWHWLYDEEAMRKAEWAWFWGQTLARNNEIEPLKLNGFQYDSSIDDSAAFSFLIDKKRIYIQLFYFLKVCN
jgi:hypothetical protein